MDVTTRQGSPVDQVPVHATRRPRASYGLAVWAALVSVYLIWGSTYLAIRFAVETLPPFTMAGFRFLFAGAVMYAWRRVCGDPPPSGRQWRSTAIVGILLLVGGTGGVVWAEQRLVSSVASLLISTVPLWIALIDAVRPGGQLPGWRTIVAVLLGFGGVVVLVLPAGSSGGVEHVDSVGAVVVVFGALSWALGSLYSRKAALPSSPLLSTSMEMLMGGTGLLLLGTLTGEWGRLSLATASARSLWSLAYLIVFGSWVAFTSYTWLLRVAPTSLVSTYAYVNPLVAVVLGYLLAGEPFTPRALVAAAIIVGSVALITSIRSASSGSETPSSRSVPAGDD